MIALPLVESCCASTAFAKQGTHHIPQDKNLSKEWVESLFAKGESKHYRGDELSCIGMPIGGLCAGQMYLRGDGTLAGWEIFNHERNSGFGDTCYRTYTPPAPVSERFEIRVIEAGKSRGPFVLDKERFPDVEFVGEYPIGRVRYGQPRGDKLPVEISLEAFSPFIPLNARDSAIPGTILRFQLRNESEAPVEAELLGALANVVCTHQAGKIRGFARNAIVKSPGMTTLFFDAEETAEPLAEYHPPEVFADFESDTYGAWKATGDAFGARPATGTLPNQQLVTGFSGRRLVNSFREGDKTTGSLISPEFTVKRPYINFRIGGGNQPGQACINLRVDGKVARTATGKNVEKLEWDFWGVSEFQGKSAVIEIVDQATEAWGHINIDDITFADAPPPGTKTRLKDQVDFGTMALTVLDESAQASTDESKPAERHDARAGKLEPTRFPLGQARAGALESRVKLQPGESKEVVFLLTWHFAAGEHGQAYAEWFKDALEVAKYLKEQLGRLTQLTKLFHDTYYDSTLPHWLLDRIMMPVANLATNTCQWWRNGRFWAWEGVGCCHGTCSHVWNYAQALARLLPELERSARTMQDLGPALDPKTGRVAFRGEGPGFEYAADGQCGTVLKCFREHLMSKDDRFLKEHWPRIKKVMEYSIARDGNADGVIEDRQHNTYDIDFVGPNTFVGALYLAALEAATRMAEIVHDLPFSERCRAIANKGRQWTLDHLWNGEYFEQLIPPGADTKFQYGRGCLADQLFGQNWANQVDLGYVYPPERIRTALKSIYRYNWAPDVSAQNHAYPPQRWFARPGEAGLFTCTWPKGERMQEPVLYRDEIWTGIEYQVAAHLIYEGMVREGLSIIRGVHDRYDGRRHNPWNEVECGDHYARSLASWGCLLALSGFLYDGPAGRLGFAPRLQADDFQAFFTAAEGWGSLHQHRKPQVQQNSIAVKHGSVALRELLFEVPDGLKANHVTALLGDREFPCRALQQGPRVIVSLVEPVTVNAGLTLTVALPLERA